MIRLIRAGCFAAMILSSGVEAKPFRVMDLNRETVQVLDSSTIKKNDGIASVWMFTHYWQAQPIGTRTFIQVKSLIEFDCARNRVRFAAIHFFADRETPIPSGDDQITSWNAIIPDAWVMKARNATCDGKFTSMGTPIWDNYEIMLNIHRRIAEQAYLKN
jgi:hypothetical protein